MSARRAAGCGVMRWVLLLVALAAAFGPAALRAQESAVETGIEVRYRSQDTVYLTAGSRAGLKVGDRLELVRDGEVVAIVEVVFLAGSSASAKPVEERAEIRPGDQVRPLRPLTPPGEETGRAEPAGDEGGSVVAARRGGETGYRPSRRRTTRFSGTASVDFESFADGDDDERDYDQATARLSLRGRDLGGLPLDLRLRLRSRQVDRARAFSAGVLPGGVPASEDRDRLYELSVSWRPESGRYALTAGRQGVGAFAGIGYLDGLSGHYRLLPSWEVGGFAGSRPELAELGFDSVGSKVGVYTRYAPEGRLPWELFVAGVREEDDAGTTRDLAVVETRLGPAGGRWALFQRAEIDLAASGPGLADQDDGGQLTQLAVALSARVGERGRFSLSYDRYDPRLLFEDEIDTPGDRFRDLLRQGLRARVDWSRPSGLAMSLSAGVREGSAEEDSTFSFGFGAGRRRPQGFTLWADLLGFSNPLTDGALLTVRSRYGFVGGHSVGLELGATGYEPLSGDARVSGWARLEGWVELPASLYARGAFEVMVGDEARGQRLRVGLGYRF